MCVNVLALFKFFMFSLPLGVVTSKQTYDSGISSNPSSLSNEQGRVTYTAFNTLMQMLFQLLLAVQQIIALILLPVPVLMYCCLYF